MTKNIIDIIKNLVKYKYLIPTINLNNIYVTKN